MSNHIVVVGQPDRAWHLQCAVVEYMQGLLDCGVVTLSDSSANAREWIIAVVKTV